MWSKIQRCVCVFFCAKSKTRCNIQKYLNQVSCVVIVKFDTHLWKLVEQGYTRILKHHECPSSTFVFQFKNVSVAKDFLTTNLWKSVYFNFHFLWPLALCHFLKLGRSLSYAGFKKCKLFVRVNCKTKHKVPPRTI